MNANTKSASRGQNRTKSQNLRNCLRASLRIRESNDLLGSWRDRSRHVKVIESGWDSVVSSSPRTIDVRRIAAEASHGR